MQAKLMSGKGKRPQLRRSNLGTSALVVPTIVLPQYHIPSLLPHSHFPLVSTIGLDIFLWLLQFWSLILILILHRCMTEFTHSHNQCKIQISSNHRQQMLLSLIKVWQSFNWCTWHSWIYSCLLSNVYIWQY